MKSIYKKGMFLLAAAGMALTFAGCGGSQQTSGQAKEVFKIGVTNFEDSLEPTANYFGWSVMRRGIGETLTRFDNEMATKPWIAESWSVSEDKLTWTFKIRDIKFSNGNPVTAEAVKKSLERSFEKAPRAKVMFEYESMTADGQNLIIKTKKPYATLPGILGDPLFIIVDVTEDGKRDFSKEGPVCTGPYVVKSFNKDKTLMDANAYYWDGKVPFKHVEFNSINDPSTRAMALQKGEIDAAVNIGAGDLSLFQDAKKFNIREISSIRDTLLRVNQNPGKPLADKNVRRALIKSLDRDTYSNVLLNGTYIPGGPLLPPSLNYGFKELSAMDPDKYDVEEAKKLLAEAGWKDTDGDGILDKDGQPLEIKFVFYSGRAELPLFAEAVQSDAKKVGIKVNLENVDYNILYDIGKKGAYDLLISNILTEQAGDPEFFMNVYFRTNVNGSTPENASGYSNSEYDALSEKLAGEFDPEKRREIIIQMEKLMMNDAGTIVLGYPKTNMVSNTSIEHADIYPCDYYWVTKEIAPKA